MSRKSRRLKAMERAEANCDHLELVMYGYSGDADGKRCFRLLMQGRLGLYTREHVCEKLWIDERTLTFMELLSEQSLLRARLGHDRSWRGTALFDALGLVLRDEQDCLRRARELVSPPEAAGREREGRGSSQQGIIT